MNGGRIRSMVRMEDDGVDCVVGTIGASMLHCLRGCAAGGLGGDALSGLCGGVASHAPADVGAGAATLRSGVATLSRAAASP